MTSSLKVLTSGPAAGLIRLGQTSKLGTGMLRSTLQSQDRSLRPLPPGCPTLLDHCRVRAHPGWSD
eukprot:3813862-Pyramimonas_sp.AAC.1